MRKLLAIDQGSSKCGYALYENDRPSIYGTVKMKAKDRKERYKMLIEFLQNLICDNDIKEMAVEDVFLKRSGRPNPKVMKIMGETRGVIIGVGLQYGLAVVDVNPGKITKYLHINTKVQNKKDVTRAYVLQTLGIDADEDTADALMIGLIALGVPKE